MLEQVHSLEVTPPNFRVGWILEHMHDQYEITDCTENGFVLVALLSIQERVKPKFLQGRITK